MNDILQHEVIDIEQRKTQALQLNINVEEGMSQSYIEQEIIEKLENGMQDLKNILDEMNL